MCMANLHEVPSYCSPFVTLCLRSIKIDRVISESCY